MIDLIIVVLSIVLLIIISAFFSAAETSITSISQATLHKLKMSGHKKAIVVSNIHSNKEKFISTLLLSNSASNTCAAALCTTFMITILGNKETTIIYASILMTIVIFMFGEVLPKSYAFLYPERTAFFTAPVISLLMKILSPVAYSIQIIINLLLPLKVRYKSNYSVISGTEELRGAIDLHHHKGSVVKTERDMLDSILDLSETTVSSVMVHRKKLFTIDIDLPIEQIIDMALSGTYTRIPLWKDDPDNIVSILHLRDLVRVLRNSKGSLNQDDLSSMITSPWFVLENTSLAVQLHEFRKRRNHFALVIDEYGDLLGVVTLEDILEEIVGQIEDEHDTISQGIKVLSPTTYIIEGEVTIRDINRELGWKLPDEQVSTLAGLIMYDTEIVPEVGEMCELYGIKFTIIEKYYNQISKIKAEILPKD
ncbi:MAG: HlyC/CorC family transporter [Rickettsiales endosymbiont of Dermacentor nuttalli]